MRVLNTLRGAWQNAIRPARNGARVIVTRRDLAGLRGHIYNPFPLPSGRWVVLIDDQYDPDRWPAYRDGFAELYRWEFVIADHGVPAKE